MATIKSNILKRWDTAPTGVRLCCIKFVQRVVQVQTPGIITDPRVRETLTWLTYPSTLLTASTATRTKRDILGFGTTRSSANPATNSGG